MLAWPSAEIQASTMVNLPIAYINTVGYLEKKNILLKAYCIIYGGDHDVVITLQFSKGSFCCEELVKDGHLIAVRVPCHFSFSL